MTFNFHDQAAAGNVSPSLIGSSQGGELAFSAFADKTPVETIEDRLQDPFVVAAIAATVQELAARKVAAVEAKGDHHLLSQHMPVA